MVALHRVVSTRTTAGLQELPVGTLLQNSHCGVISINRLQDCFVRFVWTPERELDLCQEVEIIVMEPRLPSVQKSKRGIRLLHGEVLIVFHVFSTRFM